MDLLVYNVVSTPLKEQDGFTTHTVEKYVTMMPFDGKIITLLCIYIQGVVQKNKISITVCCLVREKQSYNTYVSSISH